MKLPFEGCVLKEYPKGSVTQFFGENPDLYARFGMKAHNGADLVAPHGTPLYAVESGTVVDVRREEDGFGRHLRFITASRNGVCREWTYGHCNEIFVNVGDRVTAGQTIATMGNTGFVVSSATPFWKTNPFAGTHLHLGLRMVRRSVDGWSYPKSSIKIEVENYRNGYKGAIDPLPYLQDAPESTEKQEEKQEQLVSLLTRLVGLYKELLAKK